MSEQRERALASVVDSDVESPQFPEILRLSDEKAPKTSRGLKTRDRILAAATKVLDDRGYAETRISDIVSEADVALGTFYRYFDDKTSVLAALMIPVYRDTYVASRAPYVDTS